MLHIVFDRPTQALKAFGDAAALAKTVAAMPDKFDTASYGQFVASLQGNSDSELLSIAASGDAWGAKYGTDGPIPPGHYLLTHVETFDAPIVSEGPGQIYVADIDQHSIDALVAVGTGQITRDVLTVGGVTLPIGGLAKWNRSEIMIHGGGSNLGAHALDPDQELCKTEGCTRVHNADWPHLAQLVSAALEAGELVVYSCAGDPALVAR